MIRLSTGNAIGRIRTHHSPKADNGKATTKLMTRVRGEVLKLSLYMRATGQRTIAVVRRLKRPERREDLDPCFSFNDICLSRQAEVPKPRASNYKKQQCHHKPFLRFSRLPGLKRVAWFEG